MIRDISEEALEYFKSDGLMCQIYKFAAEDSTNLKCPSAF